MVYTTRTVYSIDCVVHRNPYMFLCSFNTYSKLFMRIYYYVTLLIMSIFKYSKKQATILETNINVQCIFDFSLY